MKSTASRKPGVGERNGSGLCLPNMCSWPREVREISSRRETSEHTHANFGEVSPEKHVHYRHVKVFGLLFLHFFDPFFLFWMPHTLGV